MKRSIYILFLIIAPSIQASQNTNSPSQNKPSVVECPPAYQLPPAYVQSPQLLPPDYQDHHEGASSWSVTVPVQSQRVNRLLSNQPLQHVYQALNVQSDRICELEARLEQKDKEHSEQIAHLGAELATLYALVHKQSQGKN